MKYNSEWACPPQAMDEAQITRQLEADVVVVGLGHSGTAAFRAAAEAGVSVIGLESMPRERFRALGRDIGHINSAFLRSHGVEDVDELEFFNEWMRRGGNRANPALIMKYVKNSGVAFDWYTSAVEPEELALSRVSYWPQGKAFDGEVAGYKFWTGTAQLPGLGTADRGSITALTLANIAVAEGLGAKACFGTRALYLEKEGARVSGLVAEESDGSCVRIKAARGVILACGDFSANAEMCEDLLPDIARLLGPGEKMSSMSGRRGDGIKMGVWAGGRIEAGPIATMGGNYNTPVGVLRTYGSLWLNTECRRYSNEMFGDPVTAGFPGAEERRGDFYVVFDSECFEMLESAPPAHSSFELTDRAVCDNLKKCMKSALENRTEGCKTGLWGHLYAGDTVEELCDNMGLEGEKRGNFIREFKRYNELCHAGRDEDFGKEKKLLYPLDHAPIFAEKRVFDHVGIMMCTCGGLLTDENQNVLDELRERIPGLYATGNCCGRRFGTQYTTPVSGVSIGIAITLGRLAGIAAACD